MALRQLLIALYLRRELCRELDLRQLLLDNVLQDITGCLHPQDKPDGAWLTVAHMLAQEDTAAPHMVTQIILLLRRRKLLEDITAAAGLGIRLRKGVLMALAREDSHGTDQNAHHSPLLATLVTPLVIMEEALVIIPALIIPVPAVVALPVLTPQEAADITHGLIGELVLAEVLVLIVVVAVQARAIIAKDLAVAAEAI